jgi:hypothetical protein
VFSTLCIFVCFTFIFVCFTCKFFIILFHILFVLFVFVLFCSFYRLPVIIYDSVIIFVFHLIPYFTSVFSGVRVVQYLVSCLVFCTSLFVLLVIVLSVFRLMASVSSNFSYFCLRGNKPQQCC